MARNTDISSHIDWYILLSVAALMLFSIASVYSASAYFADVRFGDSERLFWSRGLHVVVGLLVMIFTAKFDYHRLQKLTRPLLVVSVILLVVVLQFGTTVKGATRWLDLGPLSFQPSELAKFALLFHLATMIAEKQKYLGDIKRGFMPMLLWVLAVCGLIALQPNMSTASVIFLLSMIVIFIGGAKLVHVAFVFFAGGALGIVYALTATYRVKRILAFLGMSEDSEVASAINYQLDQAILAFANGGVFGLGPGRSRQRDWFLPEAYGDFIFSIVGEEYGFIGAVAIIGLFLLICYRGLLTAKNAPDIYGRVLASGITIAIILYAWINAGVTCGLLPTTGLPMPFISWGGTAIVFSAAAIGILLNISAQAGVYPRKASGPAPASSNESPTKGRR